MEVTKVLHMNGGIGETSYAKNSLLQEKVILMTKSIKDEAISALCHNLYPIKTIRITDLGCSSGPNTFLTVSQLIQTIDKESKKKGHNSPEFHIFLNDLPNNDFNTIFQSLLFPSNSLHFVHSSYSLHWLSQVPNGIENNKGNIYLTSTSPPNVFKGYYEQYERDFATFLKHRSKELVKGGHMVLTMLGRKNEDPFSKGCSYDGNSWPKP
ncbi:hypothetical protein P3S68_024775 [Capsicum galapagoense]